MCVSLANKFQLGILILRTHLIDICDYGMYVQPVSVDNLETPHMQTMSPISRDQQTNVTCDNP